MKKEESNNSNSDNNINQKQNYYIFNIDEQRTIQISSQFESGNIRLVKQINQLYYILEALPDVYGTSSKKSWFFFKVKSEKGIKVRIIIQNVNIYETIFEEKSHCKVMMKEEDSPAWIQSSQSFFSYMDDLSVIIDHTFKNSQAAYFSLSVPFTYSQNNFYLQKLKSNLHPNIKYKDQILTLTPKGNQVHLITITECSHNVLQSKTMVPQQRKPVIFITARVHPGQVSSSFCIQGILEFLLSYDNLQAYILRRLFIFKIIPMLNPDGVIEGNYRMDPQGFNLNRFYLEPNKDQHPAIYQILELIKILGMKQKIQYYFDLHSHSSIKEAFIYGNAFQEIVNQTYSQMFCKILQQNYPRFRNGLSNFGEQHMKHKDKGQALTKQGCGRVVISRLCGVIPSYTVQSSIFPSSYKNFMHKIVKSTENNTDYTYNKIESKDVFSFQSMYQIKDNNQNIIITENKRLGKALLVSILDMINKNPYSRLREKYNEIVCKETASKLLQNQDRFKLLDIKVNQKVKMIQHYIKQKFQNPLNKEWNLTGVYQQINNNEWPPQFKPITMFQELLIRKSKQIKMRIRTQGRQKKDGSTSLNKMNKQTRVHTYKKIDIRPLESHRSISPKHPTQTFFPEIKYSVQMKVANVKPSLDKVGTVKQMNLNFVEEEGETKHIKKRLIIDFINDEMTKITPDKQLFKKNNASLNRLVCSKIMEKQKHKSRKSQLNDYKNIVVQSRKRITTQCNEEKESLIETKIKQKTQTGEQQFKGLELKKAQIIKKRFLMNNKAIEILKRNDKSKLKLPEVNKINLVIQNTRKDRKNIAIENGYQDKHMQDTIQK